MSDLENSIEELTEQTNTVSDILRAFGGNLADILALSNRNLTLEQRNNIIRAHFNKEKQKTEEKVLNFLNNSANALLNIGRALSSVPGSFAPLTTTVNLAAKALGGLVSLVPVYGAALKGLTDATAETAKFMIDSFQEAYTIFEKLSDTGVINTFDDLKRSSNALGLTFADTEKVLSKASADLALIGGTATLGRQAFESIAFSSEDIRKKFQKIGISMEEFSEFQLSYIAQQQRYSGGQLKDLRSITDGTEKYIKELDTLSKLTGISRKQLQTEQEARLRDVRYRAGIAILNEKERIEIDKLLGAIKNIAPQYEEGIKDLIASGGVASTEASKAVLLTLRVGGLSIQDLVKKLREGSVTGYKAFQDIASAAGAAAKSTRGLASITGDQTILTRLQVESEELLAKRSSMTEQQYNEEQKVINAVIEANKGQNAELAETKVSLYNAGKNIQQLATSSEIATKAMSWMSKGFDFLTEKIYETAGVEMPDVIKARQDERKFISEYNKALEEAKDTFTTYVDEFTNEIIREGSSREDKIRFAKEKMEAAIRRREEEESKSGLRQKPIDDKFQDDELSKRFKPQIDRIKENVETYQARFKLAADELVKIKILEENLAKSKQENNVEEINRLTNELKKFKERKELEEKLLNAQEKLKQEQEKLKIKEQEYTQAKTQQLAQRNIKPIFSKKSDGTDTPSPPVTDGTDTPSPPVTDGTDTPSRPVTDGTDTPSRSVTGRTTTKPEPDNEPKSTLNSVKVLSDIRKLIGDVESYGGDYNVMVGSNEKVPLTDMTLQEVLQFQKQHKTGTAAGKYQILNKTLKSLITQMDLPLNTKFDQSLQDEMADFLIQQQSFDTYIKNPTRKNKEKLLSELSNIWAGLPMDDSGVSRHSGVGNNKAHIGWEDALSRFKEGGIATGPESGYLAELHGTEAVVPLPNGLSIPVDLNTEALDDIGNSIVESNNNLATILTDTNDNMIQSNNKVIEKLDNLLSLFSIATTKISASVDLLQSSNNIQRNLLNNSMN